MKKKKKNKETSFFFENDRFSLQNFVKVNNLIIIITTEEIHTHLLIGLRGLSSSDLLLLLLTSGDGGSGGGSGHGLLESLRVLQKLDDLLSGLVGERASNRDVEDVLVSVGHGVRNRGDGGVAHLEGDTSDVLDTLGEVLEEIVLGQVQDLGVEDSTLVVDELDGQTVLEGTEVQLDQQSGLRRRHLLALLDELDSALDLNLTLNNHGGDVQGLQESSLSGVKTGGTRHQIDITRGNGTDTSGGTDLVLEDTLTDGGNVTVGEDETQVTVEPVDQLGVLGELLLVGTEDLTNNSVLTHKDDGITTEGGTDPLEVRRTNVVGTDDEDLLVLSHERQETLAVLNFLLGDVTVRHYYSILSPKGQPRMFKPKRKVGS